MDKPSFANMVNSFNEFKEILKDKPFKTNIDNIQKELKDIYSELSKFIHKSIETSLGWEKWNDISLGWEKWNDQYLPFIDYDYNMEKFKDCIKNVWRIVDLVASIFIITLTNFYEYESSSQFLNSVKRYNNRGQKIMNDLQTFFSKILTKTSLNESPALPRFFNF